MNLVDHDAERSIVGGLLVRPELLGEVEVMIQPRHMSEPKSRAIYAAMLSLRDRGREPDIVAVRGELRESGVMDDSGGAAAFLGALIDGLPPAISLAPWASRVRELARRRAAHEMLLQAAERCTGDSETDEILESVRTGMDRLQDAGSRGITQIRDVARQTMSDLEEYARAPRGLMGVTTGLPELDRLTSGLRAGSLWMVAAFTSRGKSSLVTQIAVSAARTGKSVLMFSMEMPPPSVVERMVLAEARTDKYLLRYDSTSWERVGEAVGRIIGLPIWFDARECPSAPDVRSAATRHQAAHGCDLIVVDHLQRMATTGSEDWLSVGQNAQALKSLAMRLRVPVLCACQLTSDAEEKRPTMAHLGRSRAIISQEADIVALLHPPDMKEWKDRSVMTTRVDLLVEKQRGGACGDVPLLFHRDLTSFSCVAQESDPPEPSLPYKED